MFNSGRDAMKGYWKGYKKTLRMFPDLMVLRYNERLYRVGLLLLKCKKLIVTILRDIKI